MKNKKILINTKDSNYNIYIGSNLIAQINKILKKDKINAKNFLIIKSKQRTKFLKRNISLENPASFTQDEATSLNNHNFLELGKKVNKIEILFKKIEKND